jgi:hypothetical protein
MNMTSQFYNTLLTALIADVDVNDDYDCDNDEPTRTELDSHANMPVVGRNAYIISDTGRVAEVNPFTTTQCRSPSWMLQYNMTVPTVESVIYW